MVYIVHDINDLSFHFSFYPPQIQPIPWDFDVDKTHFWIHYGFVIFGGVFALISFFVQSREPATYGKHEIDSTKYKQVAARGNGDQNPCVQLTEVEDETEAENESKVALLLVFPNVY